MPRKQVGAIDADLLAEVDRRAEYLGQTRRVFIERTLQKRLAGSDVKVNGQTFEAGEPVYVPAERPVGLALQQAARSSRQTKDFKPYPKGKR